MNDSQVMIHYWCDEEYWAMGVEEGKNQYVDDWAADLLLIVELMKEKDMQKVVEWQKSQLQLVVVKDNEYDSQSEERTDV